MTGLAQSSRASILLDADVLIDLLRPVPAATDWLATLADPPMIAGFAAMEFLAGCRNKRELSQGYKALRPFVLLWPTEADMQRAVVEYLPLHRPHGIGLIDLLIAATATGAGLTLVTLNIKHFRHVPGLTILRPYVK